MTSFDCDCRQMEFMKQLEELTLSVKKTYESVFEAFMLHKNSSLATSNNYGAQADKLLKEIAAQLFTQDTPSGKEPLDKLALLEIIKSMDQIRFGAVKLGGGVSNKIKEAVLFSDRAVAELKDLFGVVIDCLGHVTDLALTRNTVIAEHLVTQAKAYSDVINDYASEHEERLIKGICLPKSSIIYLTMLDTLKDVLWNIKSIGDVYNK